MLKKLELSSDNSSFRLENSSFRLENSNYRRKNPVNLKRLDDIWNASAQATVIGYSLHACFRILVAWETRSSKFAKFFNFYKILVIVFSFIKLVIDTRGCFFLFFQKIVFILFAGIISYFILEAYGEFVSLPDCRFFYFRYYVCHGLVA